MIYPISFREEDTKSLTDQLKLRHSVELIGMKRVGISNFLRFFLDHHQNEQHQLLIAVDLNNLVEFKIYPFWILTFKRLVDAVENSSAPEKTKKQISHLFSNCIQAEDLFLTVDSIRQALLELIKLGILPTIFFIRFDRLSEVVNDELLANLQALVDATDHKLAYVFTSYRPLLRQLLPAFCQLRYVKPANNSDIKMIFDTFESTYELSPSDDILKELIRLSGGHVQYLLQCLIILKERANEKIKAQDIQNIVLADERIHLQSEEIWESLNKTEQQTLQILITNKRVLPELKEENQYLWDTGIINHDQIFSPLLEEYVRKYQQNGASTGEMTKKEHTLFNFFLSHIDQVCERDAIIEAVWPEYEELGVSDWTLDRLVARVREKLKKQNSPYSITTVRTRGYKLIAI